MLGKPKFKVGDRVFTKEARGVLIFGVVEFVASGSYQECRNHVYGVRCPTTWPSGVLFLNESRLSPTVTQEIVNAYRAEVSGR